MHSHTQFNRILLKSFCSFILLYVRKIVLIGDIENINYWIKNSYDKITLLIQGIQMGKLSRQTKETIKTIVVLLIVALLMAAYVIYPLNKTKTMFAREDVDSTFTIDSLPPNEIGAYADSLLVVDSFRIESDGLTSLACLEIHPQEVDSIKGTVVIIPEKSYTRESYIDQVKMISSEGYSVIIYDPRATGRTSGSYFGFGISEATDLEELVSSLFIRAEIVQPLSVIGYGFGADAALIASSEEERIDKVVLINPYLTTGRALDKLAKAYDSYTFPFYKTIMFWWYKIRSGYAPQYIEDDAVTPVSKKTLLLVRETEMDNETVTSFINSAPKELLTQMTISDDTADLNAKVLNFIK